MFLHSFIYEIKKLFRAKALLFWSVLFPIILGSMFKLAFGNLATDEALKAIPVAVVLSEEETDFSKYAAQYTGYDNFFVNMIDSLSEPGEDQLLESVYVTEEEALTLLEQKEVIGILYEDFPVTLTVSSDYKGMQLEQSILSSFVSQINTHYDAIKNIVMNHPEKVPMVVEMLTAETSYNTETKYSDGDMDEMIIYFFNLISMVCLFSSIGGCSLAINHQANLSELGARRNVAPAHKLVTCVSGLCANYVFYILCSLVSLIYLIFILNINFGNKPGFVFLAASIGCITGVSFGFAIGCLNKLSENVKIGILMGCSMTCCFLSGLMMGNIRIYVEKYFPLFNQINPAALISDSFYALTVYQSNERYFQNIITLIAFSVICTFIGYLAIRREKYASL